MALMERVISSQTIDRFTATKRYSNGVVRALGFDKQNPLRTPYSGVSYGHTGFTGTYFWIEPEGKYYVILLTNRVHPSRSNKKFTTQFRKDLWEKLKN